MLNFYTMKIFNISIIAAALLTSFSSCKDFLDVEPGNSIDANTGFNSASDARNRINGLSRLIASSSYYGRNFELYGEVKGAISQSIRKEGAWINCILSIKTLKITLLQAFGRKSIIVSHKQMMFWKK